MFEVPARISRSLSGVLRARPSSLVPRLSFLAFVVVAFLSGSDARANEPHACSTTAPQAMAPADRATGVASPVTFSWSSVATAIGYRVNARVGTGESMVLGLTAGATQLVREVPAGTITWMVEALFNGCPPTVSAPRIFTTAASCPASGPVLVSPPPGATSVASPVEFQWQVLAGASNYRLFVSLNNGPFALVGESILTRLTKSVPGGAISWYVEAVVNGCPNVSSERRTFTVATASTCTTDRPALLTPASGAANLQSPVEFSWSAVPRATGYNLTIFVDGGAGQIIAARTTETRLSRIVPPGNIEWLVEALFDGCSPNVSARSSFSIQRMSAVCPTVPPSLTAPAPDATVTSPVTMSWTAVTGATSYRVWSGVNGSAPVIVGALTATTLSRSLPSGSIEWFVEAVTNSCPSLFSRKQKYTVSASTTCSNARATLVSPAIGAANVTSPVEFVWTAVPGAIGYRVLLIVGTNAPIEIGLTTETRLSRPAPPGQVEWVVESFFNGCPSTQSDRGRFSTAVTSSCPSVGPTLLIPSNGLTGVSSPVEFSWSAVTDAGSYRVWLVPVITGAPGVTPPQPVVLGETVETRLTRPIPPGTFEWFVEALPRGCRPVASTRSRFTVQQSATCTGATATPLAPANGATGVISPVTFTWNAAQGAVAYELWISLEGAAPSPVALVRDATTVSRPIPPGRITWFVRALFAGCPPTDSPKFQFVSTVPAGCPMQRPTLLSPPELSVNLTSPVEFVWTAVGGATGYRVVASVNGGAPQVLGTTTATRLSSAVNAGSISWSVEALVDRCPGIFSRVGRFSVGTASGGCASPGQPRVFAPGEIRSGDRYEVRWSPVPGSRTYDVQESSTVDFSSPASTSVSGISAEFTHNVTAPTSYYYRVRAISDCGQEQGLFSTVVRVTVVPPPPPASRQFDSSKPVGDQQPVVQSVFVAGGTSATSFTATVDKPWLTVAPASGTIPVEGITLTVTANTTTLGVGTNTGTVNVVRGTASSKSASNGLFSSFVPVSVSLVTPVSDTPKDSATPDALIIPAVAHAAGANSQFQSDVRIANTSTEVIKYDLTYTPSGTNGTITGKQSTLDIAPGATVALDDMLKSLYGIGSGGENATGVLEIRPTSTTGDSTKLSSFSTAASSRTYNLTANGTFGQFIPAVPYSKFVGKTTDATKPSILSLQQIAESPSFRTNFGIVEGSGETATVLFSVYNSAGTKLTEFSESFQPGEHRQLDRLLATKGITLADGRVELAVTSDTGRITGYASVIDNITNDPLVISPTVASEVSATKYVIPGVAELTNAAANFKTDIRLYNGGTAPETATLTFYPMGSPTNTKTATMTIAPGEVKVIDNSLPTLYNVTGTGGAIHVTTAAASKLVATARTYNQTANGTLGQYIPAVTPAEGVGLGDRALQVLQIEESDRFRSNLGLAEMTGNPVTVEIVAVAPDLAFAPVIEVAMAANEFVQLNQIMKRMNLTTAYNVRLSVRVLSGTGKVTAYGSVIDNTTQDPTYVPAQ